MIHAHYLLFVGREGKSSRMALSCLEEFVAIVHGDDAEIRVVVVSDDPLLAEQHAVLATPMIVRTVPLPSQRVVGVPDSPSQLADALGVRLDRGRPEGVTG